MKKIVRDIQKHGDTQLTLREKTQKRKVMKNREKHVLDLSGFDSEETTAVITTAQPIIVNDVIQKRQATSTEKIMFRRVDSVQKKRPNRIGDMLKLAIAGSVILGLVLIVNIYYKGLFIKDQVVVSAYNGYQQLLDGGSKTITSNIKEANASFEQAKLSFDQALQDLSFIQTSLSLPREKTVASVDHLLQTGQHLSIAGQYFAQAVERFQMLPGTIFAATPTAAKNSSTQQLTPTNSTTDELKKDLELFNKAIEHVEQAHSHLSLVDQKSLPIQFQDKIAQSQQKLDEIVSLLQKAQSKIPVLLKLLGDRYMHRYLILLQNDTEVRPTGGFIGSYILVDVNDGRITRMDFHDVYEADGQLQEDIPAPEDISAITKTWRLRDSNYSPDFALSAEKAAWFLQKEKGPSVDTIIAINQQTIAELLGVTGPLSIPELSAPLSKDNFQQVISYIIESKLHGKQDPKMILRSIIPAFQQKLLAQKNNWPNVMKSILKSVQQKDLLFYSRDEEIQKFFEESGMAGRIQNTNTNEDFSLVTAISIGGNKSDRYIEQNINHTAFIDKNGIITDQVEITRKHTWSVEQKKRLVAMLKPFDFEEISPTVENILGKGTNKSTMKVYAPLGSKLIRASGVKLDEVKTREDQELQKTYFMFPMSVEAGSQQTISVVYELPQKLKMTPADTYRLNVEFQPGFVKSQLNEQLIPGSEVQIYQKYPENLAEANGGLALHQPLTKPVNLSVLVGR